MVQLINSSGAVIQEYQYDAFGVEYDPDANDTNYFRYTGQYFDTESGTYYLRARYYAPTRSRFLSEDTHWNTGNMIYGDDPLCLNGYTYMPNIAAIMQSSNLYVYCGNNPLMWTDPTGEAWWHWALGAAIVIGCAVAVVATAGVAGVGIAGAAMGVASVASGTAAISAGFTLSAGALLGSSLAFGTSAFTAYLNSENLGEFYSQGNWGTVAFTAAGAIAGMIYGGRLNQDASRNLDTSSFTRSNFRSNLQKLTGESGSGAEAHHVLPVEFASNFSKAGINIHDPMFGSWVNTNIHRGFSYDYNQDWLAFFNSYGNKIPTAAQILSFAAELADKYGFEVMFK